MLRGTWITDRMSKLFSTQMYFSNRVLISLAMNILLCSRSLLLLVFSGSGSDVGFLLRVTGIDIAALHLR